MPNETFNRFRAAYWQVMRELDAVRLRQWETSRLTLPQLRVIFQIRRSPGVTIGQLSKALGITASTVSGLVTKLVDAGLVVRTTAAEDRRQLPLHLTENGISLAGELYKETQPFLQRTAEGLGEDLEQVTQCLESLARSSAEARLRLEEDLSTGEG
jgi:DNA-binding MarR family transcriptional regulator